MATVLINTPEEIGFCNSAVNVKKEEIPTLKAIASDWDTGDGVESGIVFEIYGAQFPILTANDARKLSKWLARAADTLENVKPQKKKSLPHYEPEDEENYGFRFKG